MSFFTYKPNIGAAIFARGASVTAIMGSHDVDEAVLLSDRIVMLTNSPGANIGPILDVDIPRPHKPIDVVEHPSYYSLGWEIIYLLNQHKRIEKIRLLDTPRAEDAGILKQSKTELLKALSKCLYQLL